MVIRGRTSTADGATEAAADPDALIARVALGDKHAFADLYDIIAGPILGVVTRVLRDRAQSEEVTQEVFLEIWLKAAQFSARRGKVLAWAVTMAHHRAVDRVRHERATAVREDRAERLELRQPIDSVVETTLAGLEQEQIRRALDELTELQRQSIVLAYYEGYTYREVAEILATPIGTIKSRMRDGLIRLRDRMGVNS